MTDKNQTSENRELPAHIKDLANKIKAGISVDFKTGIGKEIDDAYMMNLVNSLNRTYQKA